jgi:U32 family peptidase
MKAGLKDSPAPVGVRVPPGAGRSLPELLAPAGDWECARAAVENGADGIYFGLERFNARMRAHNFTLADLPELMTFLHQRGVKGYVTFNTLVFAEELADAEQFLRAIIGAGVDAAIVQDVGMARLIRAISPDFPIHASTQMSVTSAAGVEFAASLGCDRVILARECPLAEIGRIQDALAASPAASGSRRPELEVFVHGALCVAYSGQCLTSESLGGRSANRGECAQACRMPFELISDGQPVPLGDRRYLLSPQDLAAVELLPEIARLGIASVKIEGRLKSPEYVANITRIYRKALARLGSPPRPGEASPGPDGSERYELEMAFSRGLYSGWMRGINNQELVHARFGKKRGVYLGRLTRVQNDRVFLALEAPLKPGDGVVFDAGRPDQKEEGGRVYEVRAPKTQRERNERRVAGRQDLVAQRGETMLAFGRGDIDFRRVQAGDRLWKTDDPEMDRRIRQTFAGNQPQFQRPIRLEVHGTVGQPMTVTARDETGHVVRAESQVALSMAANQPLTPERLQEQLGRLGGTPFRLESLDCLLEGPLILPVSELNRLRRELVAKLLEVRAHPAPWTLRPVTPGFFFSEREKDPKVCGTSLQDSAQPSAAVLAVLVRNFEQFDAALASGVKTIYCEFEDLKKYREAVARFRARVSPPGEPGPDAEIFAAPPRIAKMGEEWMLRQVRACEADGYLVRNYDHLRFFEGTRRRGDFSLNVANPLAAAHFIRQCGLERVTASYDLNSEQLAGLLRAASPAWFEITIHQHMPMFHMEHCVFCAFLSQGTDYRNCGRPCDQHAVELRDRVGARHPVKADAGCRNTVFNALAQTGAEHVAGFLALGARRFRIEFVNESADQARRTISMYQRLLCGEITGTQVWQELKVASRLGVTRGPREREEAGVPRFGEIEW